MTVDPKEAEWLLAEKYGGVSTPEYLADLERLASGEPLAYVIGHVDFLGVHIDLSMHPLIPRPETEWWVGEAIAEIETAKPTDTPLRLLDVYTGSGCIGIGLAEHFPRAHVDLGDIATIALIQAQQNVEINRLRERVRSRASDGLRTFTGPYDAIFANPPYIARSNIHRIDDSVLDHEPHEALFAEQNGLLHVAHLLNDSFPLLVPGGALYVEFDDGQEEEIAELAKGSPFGMVEIRKDQYGKWRWFRGVKSL